MRGRFPWGLTIASALAFALLCSLGIWQVQRLKWKEGLIAAADAAASRPPAPLAEVLSDPSPEFRRVVVDCPGLAAAPFVELNTIGGDGAPGVRLISACRPAGGPALLVDRGFVDAAVSARPPVSADATPMRIEGVLRRHGKPNGLTPAPSNGRFFGRDDAAIAAALKLEGPLTPWTLFATTSTNPEWSALKPSAPPAAFSNNHLGYAITWFGLALALAGVYVALLRRKLTS